MRTLIFPVSSHGYKHPPISKCGKLTLTVVVQIDSDEDKLQGMLEASIGNTSRGLSGLILDHREYTVLGLLPSRPLLISAS